MTQGLVGRIGHGHRGGPDWVSRDYADVNCKATGCKWNIGEKCMVPSQCSIGDDGRCKGFRAVEAPKKIDGD